MLELALFSALAGAFGAWIGAISYNSEYERDQEKYQDAIDERKREKQAALDEMDLNWKMAVEEANKKADAADKQTTIVEDVTGTKYNNELDAIRLGQKDMAYGFNNQMIENSMQTADALQAMSQSGTRSSSMQQAVDMQAAANAESLQKAEDSARAQNNLGLANLFGSLTEAKASIQQDRQATQDIRDSYAEGGDKNKMYQLQRSGLEADYDYQIKQTEKDKKYQKDNYWWGLATNMFAGGQTGYSMASSFENFQSDWANYDFGSSFDNIGKSANNSLYNSTGGTLAGSGKRYSSYSSNKKKVSSLTSSYAQSNWR